MTDDCLVEKRRDYIELKPRVDALEENVVYIMDLLHEAAHFREVFSRALVFVLLCYGLSMVLLAVVDTFNDNGLAALYVWVMETFHPNFDIRIIGDILVVLGAPGILVASVAGIWRLLRNGWETKPSVRREKDGFPKK